MITTKSIRDAVNQFEAGKRPASFGTPKTWYLRDDATGRLYPLKAIWALANGIASSTFNTSTPIAEIPRLTKGFTVVESSTVDGTKYLQEAIDRSRSDSSAARRKRLATAPKKPSSHLRLVSVFDRNPDVVAEVLFQADGICGSCGSEAPFIRRSDRSPFLEVHHITPLADGGEDTVENALALCPNCHREAHFG